MIEWYKNNRENYLKKTFEQKIKKPGLKFNPILVLISAFEQLDPTIIMLYPGPGSWKAPISVNSRLIANRRIV